MSRRASRVAVATGLLALTGAGVAYASVPSSTTGLVNACYATSSGSMRIIDTQLGQTCHAGENQVKWNATGPAGPAGAPGATGPQGTTGPQGPAGPGSAVVESRNNTSTLLSAAGNFATVVTSLSLSPGRYQLTARATVVNQSSNRDYFRCLLHDAAGVTFDGATETIGPANPVGTLPLQGVVDVQFPTAVYLVCQHDSTLPSSPSVDGGASIEARTAF